jgi:integrase
MGSLRKRGDVWWIRYYRNGKRYEQSTRTKREKVARKKLKLIEGEIAKGLPVTPAIEQLTFKEAVQDVVNDYRVNGKRSLADVQCRIDKHLLPFFGHRRMVSISSADARAYVAKRQAETEIITRAHQRRRKDGTMRNVPEQRRTIARPSNGQINRELAILGRAFALAVEAGKLLHMPKIKKLKEQNVRTGFFERDEFERVRTHLQADLQPVVTFAYLTGWRIDSEILSLQWRQVDLHAGTVRLDPGTTKNSEGRLLPFRDKLPELRDVLEQQWRRTKAVEQERGAIIASVFHRNGKPIRDMRAAWISACEAAGCPQRIRHDFRRTAVRNLERAGVSRSVAMKITGHLTESVYRRYAIVSEGDISDGLAKLATLTGTESGTATKTGKVRRIRATRISSEKSDSGGGNRARAGVKPSGLYYRSGHHAG